MLDAQNLRVAMPKDWLKPLKAALVPADGINDKMTRGIEHDLMACEPFNDDQGKIHPGHHAACGDKVLMFDHQPVRIKLKMRPILAQLRSHAPMGGDRAAFVDASGRDPGDTHTGGADQTALCGAVFEPEITPDGSVIEIDEAWSAGDADCCYQAEVAVKAANAGAEVEIFWYDGDGADPVHTISFSTP